MGRTKSHKLEIKDPAYTASTCASNLTTALISISESMTIEMISIQNDGFSSPSHRLGLYSAVLLFSFLYPCIYILLISYFIEQVYIMYYGAPEVPCRYKYFRLPEI